jgi:lysozyme family protein
MPGGVWRNLDYSGPLTKEEVDQVQRNYPLYKEAEGITGVNWKVIAAVHYRESDLGMNKAAQGNEFQFSGSLKKRATGDLLHDALETGNILQEKALRGGIWPLLPDQSDGEGVRIALFQYNGTGYRKLRTPGAPIYDQSPYVMNQIDDQHRDMKKYRFDHEPIPTGTDKQMGAVPFIREMAKAFFD